MELPPELQFERLSFEEKYRRAVSGYMKRICDLYEAVADRFGEEGLDLIREVSRDYGTRIANNVRKKGELRGVAGVGRYLLKVLDMVRTRAASTFSARGTRSPGDGTEGDRKD